MGVGGLWALGFQRASNGLPTGFQRAHLGRNLGVAATLHFLGPKGTPGGTRAYTRELEDYVTPCGRLATGARGTGGGSRPTHGLGGGMEF